MTSDPTDPNAPDGGPAFPLYLGVYAGTAPPHIKGMSLRDYFAGQAMAAVMLADAIVCKGGELDMESYTCHADECYRFADELLKRRKEKK